jgi:hypothetical protein
VAFALLAVATVGAFFLTQSLKTKNPVVFGNPEPTPAALNPVSGRFCTSRSGQRLDYRETQILVIPSHADSVGVYVVSAADAGGSPVATVTSGVQMKAGGKGRWFMWNGRLSGGQVAPPGSYFFRIVLNNEDRTINLSDAPIQVVRSFPHPRVLSVVLGGGGGGGPGNPGPPPPTPGKGRDPLHRRRRRKRTAPPRLAQRLPNRHSRATASGRPLRRAADAGERHLERGDRRPAGTGGHLPGGNHGAGRGL